MIYMTTYTSQIEKSIKAHYDSLNQKDKRHYAWIEAMKLWYWWNKYMAGVLKCNVQTIMQWIKEINNPDSWLEWRIRRLWWGDRKRIVKNPKIVESFDKVIKEYTAWSPIKEWINWTNLRPSEIIRKMKEEDWIEVSVYIVNEILMMKKLWKRKLHKWETLKSVPWRNEQFENIKRLKEEATKQWNPTISVDTKKKGAVGEFH